MLSAILEAEAFTESRARCAYRAVVWTWVWPGSLPIALRHGFSVAAGDG